MNTDEYRVMLFIRQTPQLLISGSGVRVSDGPAMYAYAEKEMGGFGRSLREQLVALGGIQVATEHRMLNFVGTR